MPTTDLPPILDLSALWAMETDFHDTEPVRNFVRDFISIWDYRYTGLLDATADHNQKAALSVLGGIKVSSVMIGATRLRMVAEDIECRLRRGEEHIPDRLLVALHDCGQQTVKELNESYLKKVC